MSGKDFIPGANGKFNDWQKISNPNKQGVCDTPLLLFLLRKILSHNWQAPSHAEGLGRNAQNRWRLIAFVFAGVH